uniref:DUF19 domain-containing protein n=1 Tax=Ascaris lumbricoides TaxID=6252 RepID=A0A9J2PKH8_ASCLU
LISRKTYANDETYSGTSVHSKVSVSQLPFVSTFKEISLAAKSQLQPISCTAEDETVFIKCLNDFLSNFNLTMTYGKLPDAIEAIDILNGDVQCGETLNALNCAKSPTAKVCGEGLFEPICAEQAYNLKFNQLIDTDCYNEVMKFCSDAQSVALNISLFFALLITALIMS